MLPSHQMLSPHSNRAVYSIPGYRGQFGEEAIFAFYSFCVQKGFPGLLRAKKLELHAYPAWPMAPHAS